MEAICDSGSDYEEEEDQYTVPNLEYMELPEDTKILIPKRMQAMVLTTTVESLQVINGRGL